MEGLADGDICRQTGPQYLLQKTIPDPNLFCSLLLSVLTATSTRHHIALTCCVVKIVFTLLHGKFQVTHSLRIGITSYPQISIKLSTQ